MDRSISRYPTNVRIINRTALPPITKAQVQEKCTLVTTVPLKRLEVELTSEDSSKLIVM